MSLKYKSFYWCLGTTSFRTKNFNKRIEQQLALLRDFWSQEENSSKTWKENNVIQTSYYDFLHKAEFIYGNAPNKSKDAREKTSGLVALGFIDANRKLTEAGRALLTLSEQNNFAVDNLLGLPADSFIYFKQLLKTSLDVEKSIIRPFAIEKLDGLYYDEFTYILPLCIDRKTTLQAVENIKSLREGKISINDIISARIMERDNYRLALKFFLKAPFITEDIIAEIGINRKSRNYDKAYFPLYVALHKFYVEKNANAVNDFFTCLRKLSNTGTLWQQYLFGKEKSLRQTSFNLQFLIRQVPNQNFVGHFLQFCTSLKPNAVWLIISI